MWRRSAGLHHDHDGDGGDKPAQERATEHDVKESKPEEPEQEADKADLGYRAYSQLRLGRGVYEPSTPGT